MSPLKTPSAYHFIFRLYHTLLKPKYGLETMEIKGEGRREGQKGTKGSGNVGAVDREVQDCILDAKTLSVAAVSALR